MEFRKRVEEKALIWLELGLDEEKQGGKICLCWLGLGTFVEHTLGLMFLLL